MPQAEPQTRAVRVVQGEGLLDIEDGDFEYWPGFLDAKETSTCFAALQSKIDWHTPRVFVYGRWIDSPRQSAWYGDGGAVYRYSGTINEPIPWLPELKNLGERFNDFCKSLVFIEEKEISFNTTIFPSFNFDDNAHRIAIFLTFLGNLCA